jgi:hypothetical protein
VIVMPDLCSAHPAEKFFGAIRIDARGRAVEGLMVDPLHCELTMERIP